MKRRCKRCRQHYTLDMLRATELARDLQDALNPQPEHVQRPSDLAETAFRYGWLRHSARQVAFELAGNCGTCALILASEAGARDRARESRVPA